MNGKIICGQMLPPLHLGYSDDEQKIKHYEIWRNDMIRLTELVDLRTFSSIVKEELTDKQKKLDVDGDGKLEKSDFEKLRAQKEEIGPKDQVDSGEYDYEGDMAKNQLRTIIRNAQMLHDMLDDQTNLPEWVQGKITLAKEYTQSAAQYLRSEKDQNSEPKSGELSELSPNLLRRASAKASDNWEKHDATDDYHHKKGVDARKKGDISTAKKHAGQSKTHIAKAEKSADQALKFGSAWRAKSAAYRTSLAQKKIKNPKTGKDILATSAINDPSHPAYNAAKSALGKK